MRFTVARFILGMNVKVSLNSPEKKFEKIAVLQVTV